MERKEYLDKATSKIFNYKAKKEVEQELSAHIDDRRDGFADIESDERSAEERAVEAMGDAELIYEELGELHNDFYNPAFDIIYTVILGGAMAGLYYLLEKFVVGDPGVASLMLSALFLPPFLVTVIFSAINIIFKSLEFPDTTLFYLILASLAISVYLIIRYFSTLKGVFLYDDTLEIEDASITKKEYRTFYVSRIVSVDWVGDFRKAHHSSYSVGITQGMRIFLLVLYFLQESL